MNETTPPAHQRGDLSRRRLFTTAVACALALAVALLCPATSLAQGLASSDWFFTFYVQQSFPKQTNTNQQIEQINGLFGTSFDTWDDVLNLNLGMQLYKRVAPRWKVGLQLDYSRGGIDGTGTTDLGFGPLPVSFEQTYSTYADLYATAHFLPCPDCDKVLPFFYGGIGIAYEKDETTLILGGDCIPCHPDPDSLQYLKVKNDGTFPSYSVGAGLDIFISRQRDWYIEVGGAYVWARLKQWVPAEGTLAPAPEIEADSDLTGPNYWIGIGKRF